MIFPQQSDWTVWGIANPAHRLFTLVWEELFSELTADTWQVRTCNIRALVQEIVEVCEVAEAYEPYRHNVPPLLEEAKAVAALDPVIPTRFPCVEAGLRAMRKSFLTDKDLPAVRRQGLVMLNQLHRYRGALTEHARTIIQNARPHEKEVVYNVARCLATELSTIGYSTPYLQGTLAILTDASEPDYIRRFDRLMQACAGNVRKYSCVFSVYWPARLRSCDLRDYGIRLESATPATPRCKEEREFYERSPRQNSFAHVDVEALDPISARQLAEVRLANASAALRIFVFDSDVRLEEAKSLVWAEGQPPSAIGRDASRLRYMRNASSAERRLESLAAVLDVLPQEDSDHLAAALQYHRLAGSAATDDGRLVNMWIALECMVRRASGKSVIDRVCKYVPKAIAVMYPRKLLAAFAIDIRRSWEDKDVSELLAACPQSRQHQLHGSDLLDAILEPDGGPKIASLQALLDDHMLLRYRLFRFRESYFKSGLDLAKCIETHRKNVDWQLRRIYRERNDVMHRGRCSNSTRHLVQHLHTYLVIVFHSLLHDLLTKHATDLPEVLEYRRMLYEHHVDRLKARPPTISRQALLSPDKAFGPSVNPPVWPEALGCRSVGRSD